MVIRKDSQLEVIKTLNIKGNNFCPQYFLKQWDNEEEKTLRKKSLNCVDFLKIFFFSKMKLKSII